VVQSLAEGAKSDNGRLERANIICVRLQAFAVRMQLAILALLSLRRAFVDAVRGVWCVTV
jgi:hypothetical protein